MKKALLSCLVLFTGISLSLATEKVTTKVYFGKSSKGCSGFGVCSVHTTTQSGQLAATWQYDPDAGTLLLDLPEEDLTGHEGQISNNRFLQEEDLKLPEDLCRQLAAAGTLTIPAGKYVVRRGEGRYIVIFTARED